MLHEIGTVSRDIEVDVLNLASRAVNSDAFEWDDMHHEAYKICVFESTQERARHFRASSAIHPRGCTIYHAA